MKVVVTGTAGFIGFYVAKILLEQGDEVLGIDNINDYYSTDIKYGRLEECGIQKDKIQYGSITKSTKYDKYSFLKLNLEDKDKLFEHINSSYDCICNLSAQAGVRYSLKNPYSYINSNIVGFINILEVCRQKNIKNLSYASSSSVYGLNTKMPFSTKDSVDHPISLYAATKKSNELMAHTYSYLYDLQTTGLRFFTAYGPWGRPDMALFKFTKAIFENKEIEIFNNGDMKRDFTYIDDIANGVVKSIKNPAHKDTNWDSNNPNPSSSPVNFKIYNIGNNNPVNLMDFIDAIEKKTNKKAKKTFLPMQLGDVKETYANINDISKDLDYTPTTNIQEGIDKFIDWYKSFFKVQ